MGKLSIWAAKMKAAVTPRRGTVRSPKSAAVFLAASATTPADTTPVARAVGTSRKPSGMCMRSAPTRRRSPRRSRRRGRTGWPPARRSRGSPEGRGRVRRGPRRGRGPPARRSRRRGDGGGPLPPPRRSAAQGPSRVSRTSLRPTRRSSVRYTVELLTWGKSCWMRAQMSSALRCSPDDRKHVPHQGALGRETVAKFLQGAGGVMSHRNCKHIAEAGRCQLGVGRALGRLLG